jgi:hypothetical protein
MGALTDDEYGELMMRAGICLEVLAKMPIPTPFAQKTIRDLMNALSKEHRKGA